MQNNKIIYGIFALIILIGAIIVFTLGFNYELKYDTNNAIQINLNKQYEIDEINKIAKEVFKDKKINVEYVEEFKDTVYITTTKISEEDKNSLIEKINEKYGLNYVAGDFKITESSRIEILDLLINYVAPIVWTSLIIIIYFAIMYRKIGIIKVITISVINIIISQLLLFSLIAITRFPVGKLILSLIVTVFVISIATLICKFEKEKSNIQVENKKA